MREKHHAARMLWTRGVGSGAAFPLQSDRVPSVEGAGVVQLLQQVPGGDSFLITSILQQSYECHCQELSLKPVSPAFPVVLPVTR